MSRTRLVCFLGAAAALTLAVCSPAVAEEPALWLRYPAVSPDGSTVVFSARGDLWAVPTEGGRAIPLTMDAAHDTQPVWSPDGSHIAFASDRYGNFDLFVIPSTGGPATRLTYHSANDTPTSFTPDGSAVLFSSVRLDHPDNVQFPSNRAQPELYNVSLTGGMPTQVLTTPAIFAVWDRQQQRLAYSDNKGLESQWRKHDDSSFARDVWLYDSGSDRHTRLTDFGADDRQPVWSAEQTALYYLSERGGSFNVWRLDLDNPSSPTQITNHHTHPVRFLSTSQAGDLCYTFDGEIWIQSAGDPTSRKLTVELATDRRNREVEYIDVGRSITEFEVSPDGSEIVFVARGEVFATATEHGVTRRITDTPEQERTVSFSPDGRSLLYASERDGSWNLYRTDLKDDHEPSFFNATAIEEKVILESGEETFQPRFSPDGKEVAFLSERTELKVINLETGDIRTVVSGELNYSYIDGDQWYEWSPDGRWFMVNFLSPTRWSREVGLVPASGDGEIVNLTKSGYEDIGPRWALDGEVMVWLTDRHGMRRHAGYGSLDDVYLMFFTRQAWDRFRLTEVELEQQKEREKKAKKDDKKDEDESEDEEGEKEPELPDPVDIDLEGLENRTMRLTRRSASLAEARLTPDGETLLYLARFEKGFDLWKVNHRKSEVELLAKLNADRVGGLMLDNKGKKAFLLVDGKLTTVDVESGKQKPVGMQAKMELDASAERDYFFEHAWRQTKKKFYVEDMHNVDWDAYRQSYARFLPHLDTHWDLAELISELQGELNASHLGCYYRPRREGADSTGTLAFFPDPEFTGDGIRITEIIEGSPLEKDGARIRPGVIITYVNGKRVTAGMNWYPLLNHKAGTPVRLHLEDPESGDNWHATVKPISTRDQSRLLYKRWVRSRRAEVERLSGGRLGYAHIPTMDDRSYREIYEEIFGRAVTTEGIVLDTRFNNGGNLVEALTVLLTGQIYTRNVPRGRQVGVDPQMRWTNPSIVVMNEGNYSDAHFFPDADTELNIGETVGMPVPGTCTAVWWERLQDRSLVFGIPQVGMVDNAGDYLENKHLAPDHLIDNDPTFEATGRDQQLEKAVEVLLATIDAS